MIYLDTHIVIWLYAGQVNRLSDQASALINENELCVSPLVRLELQYLYEIRRVGAMPDEIINDLSGRIGLQVCDRPLTMIISIAMSQTWTRDPFDRLIVANAALEDSILLTYDQNIRAHYAFARA